jgi:hypothetical protein
LCTKLDEPDFWTDEAAFIQSGVNRLHNLHERHWRIPMSLDALLFSKDLASVFGPEL